MIMYYYYSGGKAIYMWIPQRNIATNQRKTDETKTTSKLSNWYRSDSSVVKEQSGVKSNNDASSLNMIIRG